MENFDQIFTLLAEHEGISLNTDILETGLINILALLAILIYTGRDFLGSLLEERKTTIVKGVQDAEDRLNEAQKRLTEAEKQLNQANLVISEIKNETTQSLKNIEEILKHQNLNLRDVVKCTVILSDINDFSKMNEIYRTFFKENLPARTTFAGDLVGDAKIEIEVVAARK